MRCRWVTYIDIDIDMECNQRKWCSLYDCIYAFRMFIDVPAPQNLAPRK